MESYTKTSNHIESHNVTHYFNIGDFYKSTYNSCTVCNGYYGPNFGQPICSTCHLFLYRDSMDIDEAIETDDQHNKKAESDDSGTEEPDFETDFYFSPNISGGDNDVRQGRAASAKVDRLTERLNALSLSRHNDTVPSELVESLPPEVLLVVFKYLDDISLWTVGNVCHRWRHIVNGVTTQLDWERFATRRWPLFRPRYRVASWRSTYARLIESSPCRYCLEGMMLQKTAPIEENSWRHRRLRSELKTLKSDPPEGIEATPLDRHCCHWQASITGPHHSPYQGGLFLVYLQIPLTYPMKPPKVRFITKIFHPNVGRHGDVGLDSIHHNWSLALTISKVLVSIQSLLTDPYCRVCMEPPIGRLYLTDREEFDRLARIWTWKYAMLDYLPSCPVDVDDARS